MEGRGEGGRGEGGGKEGGGRAGGGERRWGGGNSFVPISQMRKVRPREVMGDLESQLGGWRHDFDVNSLVSESTLRGPARPCGVPAGNRPHLPTG